MKNFSTLLLICLSVFLVFAPTIHCKFSFDVPIVTNIVDTVGDVAAKMLDPIVKIPKISERVENVPTSEIIQNEGYPSESHLVTTDDGYELTMHRIPGPPGSPIVFLQHGLFESSSDWVISGKGKGLAFILADRGYDVWMGNARGNVYSQRHTTMSPKEKRFWDFSWHEMGIYDLPAEFAHIRKIKNDTIQYVGHSMGTTMFYVMASERPDVAKQVKAMYSLAPIAFMSRLKSPLRILSTFIDQIKLLAGLIGDGEFIANDGLLRALTLGGCKLPIADSVLCSNSLFIFCGFDISQFNRTLLPIILSHSPAGASTKTFIHYSQEVKSGKFGQYDYGLLENMRRYGSIKPPSYDLSKIQVPIGLFWSENDLLAHPDDVKQLHDLLPKIITNFKVKYPLFNHLDFLWAIDTMKLVYADLIRMMDNYK